MEHTQDEYLPLNAVGPSKEVAEETITGCVPDWILTRTQPQTRARPARKAYGHLHLVKPGDGDSRLFSIPDSQSRNLPS